MTDIQARPDTTPDMSLTADLQAYALTAEEVAKRLQVDTQQGMLDIFANDLCHF